MKKIVLTLAGVLAAVAFAPEASALPVFARQTGMACNACHYQHFPLLNAFGRAFKASAFTLMGAQGRIEGDNNLSIPDTVNMAVFATAFFQTQSAGQTAGVTNAVDPAVPKWGVPGTGGELSLFFGGRVSEFAGFLAEAGLGGGGANAVSPQTADCSGGTGTPCPVSGGSTAGGGVVGAGKLVMLFPVGDARIGPVLYSSNDQGAAYSFELLNTGAVGVHKMMGNTGPADQHVKAAYASQYLGTATAATGVNVVATNDMGFLNIGAYEMAGNSLVAGANNLNLTYIRAAFLTDIAGWDAGFGIQNFGGKSSVSGPLYGAQYNAPKATIIDAQLQGDLGTMPVGFYASYGTAAASTANEVNPFGAGVGGLTKTSFNVAAEIGFLPNTTLQAAVRLAKNGVDTGVAAGNAASGTSQTDNALLLGITYALAQNIDLSFHHTQQSGSAWKVDSAGNLQSGKNANTLLLQTAF